MAQFERALLQRQHTLPRRRSKYLLRRSACGSRSSPIAVPSSRSSPVHNDIQSLAMQRWQNSPPEEEAASLFAIFNALESGNPRGSVKDRPAKNNDVFSRYRSPSSTTSVDSGISDSSLRSFTSSHSAASRSNRHIQASKPRDKTKRSNKAKDMRAADRIFKCTFCCDTFKHKYDWARHEKSLHLNLEEWVCTPHGASVVLPLTGRVHCAYCSALDPTVDHLQQHNHSGCTESTSAPRVFRRKDHLVQHLRLVHGLKTLPLIEDWRVETPPIASRCGFCDEKMMTWDARVDHLASHFRDGKTMVDWQGDHDFDPAITARVINSFPPYLIGAQSTTLVPFSATDPASIDHTNQLLSQIKISREASSKLADPTIGDELCTSLADVHSLPSQQELDTVMFADVLSRHLSRFARQQMLNGIIPTDDMFQRESRRVLYQDGEDEWNQTVADDPKWLEEFRRSSGLNTEYGNL
ncbi:hypothetical protein IQ07DRAFT_514692 [Pyrenochaeta sp. DS3sAY3a]|nr:hypothetical protein IQ07DRAFT_514692 [Pyrenochaeta sp. DS3sAY3a]